jgi:hypothetical protein
VVAVGRNEAKQLPKTSNSTIQNAALAMTPPIAPKKPILKAVPADKVTCTIGRCCIGTGANV